MSVDIGTAPAPEGTTVHGTDRPGIRGGLVVLSGAKTGTPGNPSYIGLQSVDTNGAKKSFALWVDSTGDLRIGEILTTVEALIASEAASGTVVGGQS